MRAPVRQRPLLVAGLAVLVLGTGPLLLVVLAEVLGLVRDANPIGLGLLFVASAPMGALLVAIDRIRDSTAARTRIAPDAGGVDASLWTRGLAGIAGVALCVGGAAFLASEGGRGPAASIVLGIAALCYAVRGHLPGWFRAGR